VLQQHPEIERPRTYSADGPEARLHAMAHRRRIARSSRAKRKRRQAHRATWGFENEPREPRLGAAAAADGSRPRHFVWNGRSSAPIPQKARARTSW